ncbi:hypothetical protein JCM3765_007915 [Sporobolomyces pararoseus]
MSTSPSRKDVDYSFLSSPHFTNEADWLNSILHFNKDDSISTIESTLSSTVNSLESTLQDTSISVDRTILDISTSIPRLSFDLQLMRENALLLKFTLDGIQKRGTGFDSNSPVGKVIEKIRVLDLIKQRMESSRDVLREAESWSSLESEVSGLVQEGQYLKASERLQEAARSMVVFQNTAEYEQRRSLMVSLQNQLEASLSSGLVKTITERDIKGLKVFWKIFGMIQRQEEFVGYYFGSRRSTLVTSWSEAKLLDCQDEPTTISTTSTITSSKLSSPDPLKFSQFLSQFYSELIQLLTEERTYLPAIFPNPSEYLSKFIQTTLESLNPSFSTRLNSIQQTYQSNFLLELIETFKLTEEFSVQVERIFQKLEQPPQTTSAPTPTPFATAETSTDSTTTTHHSPSSSSISKQPRQSISNKNRRSKSISKRLSSSSRSISFVVNDNGGGGSTSPFPVPVVVPDSQELSHDNNNNNQGDNGDQGDRDEDQEEVVREWEIALFEPFLDFQTDYPRSEKEYLENEINKLERQNASSADVGGGGGGGGDWWLESIEPQDYSSSSSSGAGASVKSSSNNSRGGTEKLFDKVNKIFNLFEQSLQRNLQLTHGYGSENLLKVLDSLFSWFFDQRKDELGRVLKFRNLEKFKKKQQQQQQARMRTTSGGDNNDGSLLEGTADDDIVLEGLEYSNQDWEIFQFGLKLLDTCKKIQEKLNSFESRLKSRMIVLARSIKQAREEGFTIPGTTRGEILLLRQSTLNSIELNNMLEGLEGTTTGGRFLLPRGKGASIEFTRSTQLFLHETILSPLQSHLSEYSTLPCWTTSTDRVPGGKGAFDLSIPTFSLSPTETISRVGEGLFNLPRLFEVYAQDDSLSYSIETLPFVDLDQLKQFNSSTSESQPPTNSNNSNPLPISLTLTAETVIATWLSSLTLSILSHLTTNILPSLTRLSKHGASQLVSDLDYISNVARALDVESSRELESWREAVAMDEKTLREGGGEESLKIERGILERVMKIRGVRRGSV